MNAFFEQTLVPSSKEPAWLHVLLPTHFATYNTYWEHLRTFIDTADPQIVQAQKYNLVCAKCGENTENQRIRFALRIVATGNHIGVNTAGVCQQCMPITNAINTPFVTSQRNCSNAYAKRK